jgi:DNA-binding CsgD family transcriptional regulator
MWNHTEVVALLDKQSRVCVISRNEDESPIQHVVGKRVVDLLCEDSRQDFESAFGQALQGAEDYAVISAMNDHGHVVWVRARFMPSPVAEMPVLFHFRRFPRGWQHLSLREREVIHALHESGMNPKRTARKLGITVNTLNAHRRSICQKCGLQGVGEFWVFVERCR